MNTVPARVAKWPSIEVVETHAAGEPLRVILKGWPPIPGDTILAKRRYAREHHDGLRRALMWEPRGHADMYGAILTDPVTPDGDYGVLFVHNEGFSTMCGHGVIALVTALVELEILKAESNPRVVRLDTPAGRVTARAYCEGDGERGGRRVRAVAFENVPAFVCALDQRVDVPGIGPVRIDLAFGGAFYAYCDANELEVGLAPEDTRQLIDLGMRIKRAVAANYTVRHPIDEELGFLYGTIVCGPPRYAGSHGRNVCIFADGEVDRSPTGTGVSGRLAIEWARGRLAKDEPFVVESILGTRFTGRVCGTTTCGMYDAVVPEIEGSAWLTGRSTFWLDPSDPLREGFLIR